MDSTGENLFLFWKKLKQEVLQENKKEEKIKFVQE